MIRYKIDIIDALNRAGFNMYQAKKTGLLSQGTYNKLKDNDPGITLKSLNIICSLLDLQPKDLIIYEETDADREAQDLFNNSKKDTKKDN